MGHLSDAHLVGGELAAETFSAIEREAISKGLTSGKTPKDAAPSVAFALDHCAGMKAAGKKAVAAVMVPKKTRKKRKKG